MFDGDRVEFFRAKLDPGQWRFLQAETPNVMAAIELVPVALAWHLWGSRAVHRRVFFFVDNEASRASLYLHALGRRINAQGPFEDRLLAGEVPFLPVVC